MKSLSQWVVQAAMSLALGGALAMLFSEAVFGTPEIAQREMQGCLVCHSALGKADLNDRGRFYERERTLEGYVEPTPETPPADPPAPGPGS